MQLMGTLKKTEVLVEHGDGKWNFPTISRPSRSDIARYSRITIADNEAEFSCLSPDGLHIGVLPWDGVQLRDFFALSHLNDRSGKIIMDLEKVQPVAAVASYSWQDQDFLKKVFT